VFFNNLVTIDALWEKTFETRKEHESRFGCDYRTLNSLNSSFDALHRPREENLQARILESR